MGCFVKVIIGDLIVEVIGYLIVEMIGYLANDVDCLMEGMGWLMVGMCFWLC